MSSHLAFVTRPTKERLKISVEDGKNKKTPDVFIFEGGWRRHDGFYGEKNQSKDERSMTTNIELANLIFPDAREIGYYEEKFPERKLGGGAVVTRFAPSPTGFVHIGALEQCILEMALVRQTGGVLFLRIEDTDQKRKVENGVEHIVAALRDFHICFDEGMRTESESYGAYGPYIQSARREIYKAYAKHLLAIGRAYPCFATEDELMEMRKEQEQQKVTPGYYGKWAKYRTLPADEAAARIKRGDLYAIRFRSEGDRGLKTMCHDLVRGDIAFPQNEMDIVILKHDGLPTYHFAHVVDDHLMRTTHVIRSDEWLSSVPVHLELFQAFGFAPPQYCHYSPILKEEKGKKRKISKRKDPEAAVSYYHQAGIPVAAVEEYLMGIANSDFEEWRRRHPAEDIYAFPFALEKMSVSGALFDMDKLLNIAKDIIAEYSATEVYESASKWAARYDAALAQLLSDKEYALRVLGIERDAGIKKKRKDIGKWSDVKDYISYMYDEPFYAENRPYDYKSIADREVLARIFRLYIENYYEESDDAAQWFDKIKDLSEKIGYAREVKLWRKAKDKWPGHVGDVCTAIRVGITRRSNTPDLYQILQVLGRERIKARLEYALQQL